MSAYCYIVAPMNCQDLELAVYFLRRVVARGQDEELLLNLVERIEKELTNDRDTSRRIIAGTR
jgi:hypothetical protein